MRGGRKHRVGDVVTTNMAATGFHEGELAVQRRAGVEAQAGRLENMLDSSGLSEGAVRFLALQRFATLTGREKEVCLRILSGFSSEAIAAELGISLHSTLTYRKRAYERLGISSQSELFAIVLRLLTRSMN